MDAGRVEGQTGEFGQMNVGSLLERLWLACGHRTAQTRQDWMLQTFLDALNTAQDTLCTECGGNIGYLIREATLTVVPGQALYTLNDWVCRSISHYTEDQAAHQIEILATSTADRNGARRSTRTTGPFGPYEACIPQRTTTALLSGASATAAEGTLLVTLNLSAPDKAAFLLVFPIGLMASQPMLRLGGEDTDYRCLSVAAGGGNALVVTVDRKIRGRLTGLGVAGVGANYTTVRWEISPPGRLQLQLLPAPTSVPVKMPRYRFPALPRRITNNLDETPEFGSEHHHLLLKGAYAEVTRFLEKADAYAREIQEFQNALSKYKSLPPDDSSAKTAPDIDCERSENNNYRGIPRGTDLGRYGQDGSTY